MNKNNVISFQDRAEFTDQLTDLIRSGAQQLIYQAVEAELAEFMEQFQG